MMQYEIVFKGYARRDKAYNVSYLFRKQFHLQSQNLYKYDLEGKITYVREQYEKSAERG